METTHYIHTEHKEPCSPVFTQLTRVLGIDPGTNETAWVIWDGFSILGKGYAPNKEFLSSLRHDDFDATYDRAGCEMIASYGMSVGREVFETCKVIGRIEEIIEDWGKECRMIYRKDVKLSLCMSPRAKDGNVRQALIDRIGPQGKKKAPGPTYGMASHLWSALAVAVYAHDLLVKQD